MRRGRGPGGSGEPAASDSRDRPAGRGRRRRRAPRWILRARGSWSVCDHYPPGCGGAPPARRRWRSRGRVGCGRCDWSATRARRGRGPGCCATVGDRRLGRARRGRRGDARAARLGPARRARRRDGEALPARRPSSCCRRSRTPRRSSASGSTTAPTRPRPGSSRPTARPSSASSRNALRGGRRHGRAARGQPKVDYEAEVAFVVGRRAKDVAEADALDHVAGYTLLNDLSARDLQFATPQWMPGKVFDGSAPCGPAIVTPDEAGPDDAIGIALDLNGERMQESSTADLIFASPGARRPPLEPDDARARRHRLDRDAGRASAARAPRASGWRPATRSSSARRSSVELRTTIADLAHRAERGDERERQEPDDVEVEPVGGAELDRDRHRGRERRDLDRGLEAGEERDRRPRARRRPPRTSGCRKSSDGAWPQTLNGELRVAW